MDITLLNQKAYINPVKNDWYTAQIIEEDNLLTKALVKLGFKVQRLNWDAKYNWDNTKAVVFRAVWDYHNRINEFTPWMQSTNQQTTFINSLSLIEWNLHKSYLTELSTKGINIAPTIIIKHNQQLDFIEACKQLKGNTFIIKPCISGAARNTFKFDFDDLPKVETKFQQMVNKEDMMLQVFQNNIIKQGEFSLMCFNGKYSHAVLKKAKSGDFRVQDDFGGTVHQYKPTLQEIEFAELCFSKCTPTPAYGRADVFYDNNNEIGLGELEIFEPELWLRFDKHAANKMANAIAENI